MVNKLRTFSTLICIFVTDLRKEDCMLKNTVEKGEGVQKEDCCSSQTNFRPPCFISMLTGRDYKITVLRLQVKEQKEKSRDDKSVFLFHLFEVMQIGVGEGL